MYKNIIIYIAALALMVGCAKDMKPDADAGLFERSYCNDPEAVNYNWDFPGTADSSVCFYPRDVFAGTYKVEDSIYNGEYELATVQTLYITFYALSKSALRLTGLCGAGDSINLTASRFYKASIDSTSLILPPDDTVLLDGQIACRPVDTLLGYITKNQDDSTSLRITWTIFSDTGVNYHIGTGKRQ